MSRVALEIQRFAPILLAPRAAAVATTATFAAAGYGNGGGEDGVLVVAEPPPDWLMMRSHWGVGENATDCYVFAVNDGTGGGPVTLSVSGGGRKLGTVTVVNEQPERAVTDWPSPGSFGIVMAPLDVTVLRVRFQQEDDAPSLKSDDAATILHVAVDGSDSNTGTAASPLASCKAAVSKLAAACSGSAPCTVRFASGIYVLNSTTACGTVSWNGSEARPLLFAGDPAGGTHFDAMALLDSALLKPVTEPRILKLINPAAKGKLLVMPLPVAPSGLLEWGGVPMHSSVWPNPHVGTGMAYVRKVFDRGSYYYPGRSNWSVPHPHVCLGDKKSTIVHPCGGNVSIVEQPTGDWVAEMAAGPGFGAIKVAGYLANDWERLTLTVARVEQSATNTSLQFAEYTPYGICEAMEGGHKSLVNHCGGAAPGRFTVTGFLSEVDVAGEWWYDSAAHQLYILPPDPADGGSWSPATLAAVRFGHWQGPGLISMGSNSSHVTLRDVTISGVGGGTMVALAGSHNTVGGCTLKNSAGIAVSIGGTDNRMVGNDVYDIVKGVLSTGGGGNMKTLGPVTNHLIENNHFTQVHLRGIPWAISLRGFGDRFTHNLVHDAPGQMLTPGLMQMIDGNEIFNTGYVEGDGGVIYSGASLVSGYGMQYRENFVHHSLEVPGLHGEFLSSNAVLSCAYQWFCSKRRQ
eukprot:SAG22_NODE_600_length_8677_cov_18.222429_5_plen_687_part_00